MEWRYCSRLIWVRKSANRFAIAMPYVCLVYNQVEVLAMRPHYAPRFDERIEHIQFAALHAVVSTGPTCRSWISMSGTAGIVSTD
jgi:hypothetical protein